MKRMAMGMRMRMPTDEDDSVEDDNGCNGLQTF